MISYFVRKNKEAFECVFPEDVQLYEPSTDHMSNIWNTIVNYIFSFRVRYKVNLNGHDTVLNENETANKIYSELIIWKLNNKRHVLSCH